MLNRGWWLWYQGVGCVCHAAGITLHEGLGCDIKVHVHGVTAPTANESDDITIYATEKKCHGAASSK
eukprot:5989400-Ditylum_brightwellii.AAC.1